MNQHPLFKRWPIALLGASMTLAPVTAHAQVADTTAPQVATTSPTSGAILTNLNSISGTASDETGGSGVDRVEVAIFRASDSTWWNGMAWTPTYVQLPTTLTGNNWQKNSGLPTGADLIDNDYTVIAAAFDVAGNRRQVDTPIKIDQTPPASVVISTPVNGSTVNNINAIRGTVDDGPNSSGIASINVTLRRSSDGFYWNGTMWVAAQSLLPTTRNGNAYEITTGLPTPADLSNGNYIVTTYVADNAGNRASAASAFRVLLDNAAPQLTIDTPPNNSAISSLPFVRGTVSDEAGGSGLDRVTLALFRLSDSTWWNGSAWVDTFTQLPTTITGNTYQNASALPAGTDLTDNQYTLIAQAFDNFGNRTQVDNNIRVDQTAPNVLTITNPVNGSTVNRIDSVNGTVADAPNGSGIASVDVTLRRSSDGSYWNGTAWVAAQSLLPAQAGGGFFQVTTGLPPQAQLSNGNYIVTAYAADGAGNRLAEAVAFEVLVDNAAPRVTIDTPANNVAVSTLSFVRGTVQDNDGGSGVNRVVLALLRNDDTKWWNGMAWVDAFVPLTTSLTGTQWVRDGGLPTGADLNDGRYTLIAQAFDNFGNTQQVNSSLIIDSVAPAATDIKFTNPTDSDLSDGILINRLDSITGTVADNTGGSGITDVKLTLRRASDGFYWNGTAWVMDAVALDTVNGGGFFSLSTNLPSGSDLARDTYAVTATAFDAAGNRATNSLSFELAPDFAVPAPKITTPANDAVQRDLPIVRGTAVDNVGGVGVARVTLAIYRIADQQWWNGTAFVPAFTELPTTFNDGNWQKTSGLPTGDDLRNGLYSLIAISYDRLGNRAQSDRVASTTLRIDRVAPTALTIDTPQTVGPFGTFPFLTGTARDDYAFGLDRVVLTIQRSIDGRFWNGGAWVTGAVPLATNLDQRPTPGKWSAAFASPAGRNLPTSSYSVTAVAVDRAGNSRSVKKSFNIIADNTAPLLFVDTLRNGAVLRAFPAVAGRVSDAGAGVSGVEVALNRRRDNTWWNGRSWQRAYIALPAVLQDGKWTARNLPTGLNVSDGAYVLLAFGIDRVGNRRPVTINFSIDHIAPPTLTFLRPTANSRVSSLSPITGVALDSLGGSGIASVDVMIRRAADGFYWNGQSWSMTSTRLPATLSPIAGGVRWVRSGTPGGLNLTPGLYALFATATDRAGNAATRSIAVRVLDVIKPTVTITSPPDGVLQRTFPAITGTLVDNLPDSGSVQLVIRRGSDGFYWNGTTWSATAASLGAIVNGTNWSRTTDLPSGSDLMRDVYTVQAIGRDASLNRADAIIRIPINPDSTGPVLTVASPAQNATLPAFAPIRGTVNDGPTGSGVQRVVIAIHRDRDDFWWNGRQWTDTFTPLRAAVIGNDWSLSANLPPTSATPTGPYTIVVQAFDVLGNRSQVNRSITINPNPGGGGTGGGGGTTQSPVTLSSALADAAADSVRLNWTTTLSPTTTQSLNYVVTVNGKATPIVAISDLPAAVLLTLDTDVKVGDMVVVRWTLNGAPGESTATVVAK